jgi:hypothetical protein
MFFGIMNGGSQLAVAEVLPRKMVRNSQGVPLQLDVGCALFISA